MIKYNYIAIEGNIGVGKTSLTLSLSKKLKHQIILEDFKKNIFLPLFYQNIYKYSLALELFFLLERFQQLCSIPNQDNLLIISDYFFEKSDIFSKKNLSKNNYTIFYSLFNKLYELVNMPDLIIYLENTPENLKSNINRRGREIEMDISISYLNKIQTGYRTFIKKNKKYRILIINIENIDFVKDETKVSMIFDLLKNEYPIGNTIITL